MILEQMLKDQRREGRREGRSEGERVGREKERKESLLSLLEIRFSTVPEELREKISNTGDLDTLELWFETAAKAKTLEEFRKEISAS